jgi:hypothetical protein
MTTPTNNVTVNKFQPTGKVKLIKGSILNPQDGGLRFILNIANLNGTTEAPIYQVFNKKWPKIKAEVRGWWATKTGAYKVGAIHNLAIQSDIWCETLLCQKEDGSTDLVGLDKCLVEVAKQAKYEKASVAISTLLVEAIPELSELVTTRLVNQGVTVTYYEEPVAV